MTAALALQKAVYARLTGDTALMTLISGVYDIADRAASYPYITIGADTVDAYLTKTTNGISVLLRLDIWTTALGRSPGKAIENEVYRLLHRASFSVTGFTLIDCQFDSSESSLENSDRLLRGTLRFRALIQLP